jgi:hypothetical protein
MTANTLPPMYARLGERELPVGWAWYRPEPQVGDTVRIRTALNGNDEWQTFRVVGKWLRGAQTTVRPATDDGIVPAEQTIQLEVEPIA